MPGGNELYVKLKEKASVRERTIRLGHAAEIWCARPAERQRWQRLPLAQVPPGGKHRYVFSALEVLEAGREAAELAQHEEERALCANACLLARALERRGKPVFPSGRAVLEGLSAREIRELARRWNELDRAENPSPEDGMEDVLALKKAWSMRLMSAFAGVCSAPFRPFPRRNGHRR